MLFFKPVKAVVFARGFLNNCCFKEFVIGLTLFQTYYKIKVTVDNALLCENELR